MKAVETGFYTPMELWGKDHWSLLAYIDSVMTEVAGFEVGFDPRMRQNRRNFRVMIEQNPKPKRPTRSPGGIPMDPKYGSRLNNNTYITGHDDWDCVQDMARAGLFTKNIHEIEPKVTLSLSLKGIEVANELRRHKQEGGTFGNFHEIINSEEVGP